MGPSGSGKTTLLNILSGIGKPSYGEVFIGGKNITSWIRMKWRSSADSISALSSRNSI